MGSDRGEGREAEGADAEGRDAWSTLRKARSTPPPRPPSGRPAAPVPSAPLRPSMAFGRLGDDDLRLEMRERFALGDFSGALRAAELLLGSDPGDEEAGRFADACRSKLEEMAVVRLGGPKVVLRVAVDPQELRWMGLDSRAAFVLSRIDGIHSLDQLLDAFGMPRLEALRVLLELREAGALRSG